MPPGASQTQVSTDFDLLDLHTLNPSRYPHLLESPLPGPQGRYDILFAFPGYTLDAHPEEDFLARLDALWQAEYQPATPEGGLPFYGGWFVYLSYEIAAQVETTLRLPASIDQLPLARVTRFPAALIQDRQEHRRWLVCEDPALAAIVAGDIQRLSRATGRVKHHRVDLHEDNPRQYTDAVRTVLDYIREGDVFQVNLSRAWRGKWPAEATDDEIYRQLRQSNPGPFNGLATWDEGAIFCSSPERLVEVRGSQVQTRPIAGTRPRDGSGRRDRALVEELLHNSKEQAEHIMLIDLERNDLGRIAVPGSVRVNELMALESYSSVHHIVSNVQATKRDGVTPGDVIRAVFPGGTITGCPKVRCMEIIADLERTGRGAYTGALGYLNRDGSMDLNILIRSLVRSEDQIHFRAGAGIVSDSSPEFELEETRAKARALLDALGDRP